jgi:lysophospholipase L1-like esterase
MPVLRGLLAGLVFVSVGLSLSACGGSSSSPPGPLRYTALGASDAVGVGAFPPTRNGYVPRVRDGLERQLGRSVELVNLGIPGAEIRAIEAALDASLRLGNRPNLVTLWTGPTDVIAGADPAEFEASLRRILARLRERTTAIVAVANVPDLTRLPAFAARPTPTVTTARVLAFNAAIERQATAFDAPVVRLFEQPFRSEYVSDIDGFHPSNEGHAAIAELFLRTLVPMFRPAAGAATPSLALSDAGR